MTRLSRAASGLAHAADAALLAAVPTDAPEAPGVVVSHANVDWLLRLAHGVREALPDPTVPPLHAAAARAGRIPWRYRPTVVVTATGVALPGRVRWGWERAMRKGTGAALGLTGILVGLGLLDEADACRPFPTTPGPGCYPPVDPPST